MVSVIIPACNENIRYVEKTIWSLLQGRTGEIEILVFLDGYYPDPISSLISGSNYVHWIHSPRVGMRAGINIAAKLATGEYLMKTDAHCAFMPGYDLGLKYSCSSNDIIIPARYDLNPAVWERGEKENDFQYISPPRPEQTKYHKKGFRGTPWPGTPALFGPSNTLYEIMTFQGSCWFMCRDYFFGLMGLDESYGYMGKEAQELGCKAWLSGGRVLLNAEVWYAHLRKKKRGYNVSIMQAWEKAVEEFLGRHKNGFRKLVEKFNPPGWEDYQWN